MRRLIVGMFAASLLLLSALPAVAAGPPAGAGEGGKPAGIACQQFGTSALQDAGLLATVAKDGLEYPIGGEDSVTYSLSEVLNIHRTAPATANAVLTAYADALDIDSDAIDEACPTG